MKELETILKEKSQVEMVSDNNAKHVAVLVGGMSAEREVSISSSIGVIDSLLRLGYKVTKIDMGMDISSCLNYIKPDVVFNCLHGTYGEDGSVPGLLNIMHIPYTHSGLLSSAIAFNKQKSREIFSHNGFKCASVLYVSKSDNIKFDPMKRPYVIKPLSQGSSVGVHVVFEGDDFNFADYDFKYGDVVIVEEYIKGRELDIAVLNGKAIGVLEIKLLKNKRFYDYETKYTDGFAEHICPADLPRDKYQKVLDLSEKLYNVMGCKGICRVEFIYSEEKDDFYVLELNTHPGMTPTSLCPEIAQKCSGMGFKDLVEEILKTASFEQ